MEVFEICKEINDDLTLGREHIARNKLILLLNDLQETPEDPYWPLVNRLIRNTGLFPYIDGRSAGWEERYVQEAFKEDVGASQPVTLHREQSKLLSALLAGDNIAVSAPTSFGKSFVIDAFIAVKQPSVVVIIVPTIALADETRRRLHKKFGREYKIITTADQEVVSNSILIFPQERAISYISQLENIDILIVDEFYKASQAFDKGRAPALIRAILQLSRIAKQRYFLAPNITSLKENVFTKGMEFLPLDFNTVYLDVHEIYQKVGKDEGRKTAALLQILKDYPGKTLIYAGTYTNIKKLGSLFLGSTAERKSSLLFEAHRWLGRNYDPNWDLTHLVRRGIGVHNGRLHRSISQLQIRLFEEKKGGLDSIISTSSIIEGVNTAAENVVIWSNKNGSVKIDDFTYKNIMGRGGRMFRHFVGHVFMLDSPPTEEQTQLDLEYPDSLLGTMSEDSIELEFTERQEEKIRTYEKSIQEYISKDDLDDIRKRELLQHSDSKLILDIAKDIAVNADSWNGMTYLNSLDVNKWDHYLYRLIRLQPDGWNAKWSTYVAFLKVIAGNWISSIPQMLERLDKYEIGIDEFFNLERNTSYKLASLISDVHTLYNKIHPTRTIDLTPAISRFSHVFLPTVVFQLEEYGLPRMLSRRLHDAHIINFEKTDLDVYAAINLFREYGVEAILAAGTWTPFDRYIIEYFFDGIA